MTVRIKQQTTWRVSCDRCGLGIEAPTEAMADRVAAVHERVHSAPGLETEALVDKLVDDLTKPEAEEEVCPDCERRDCARCGVELYGESAWVGGVGVCYGCADFLEPDVAACQRCGDHGCTNLSHYGEAGVPA